MGAFPAGNGATRAQPHLREHLNSFTRHTAMAEGRLAAVRGEIAGLKSQIAALKEKKNAVLREDNNEIDWEAIGRPTDHKYEFKARHYLRGHLGKVYAMQWGSATQLVSASQVRVYVLCASCVCGMCAAAPRRAAATFFCVPFCGADVTRSCRRRHCAAAAARATRTRASCSTLCCAR